MFLTTTWYSEDTKLVIWVGHQRTHYRWHLEEKRSQITNFRIKYLESLGLEWKPYNSHRKGTPKKPCLDDDATRVCERVVGYKSMRKQRHRLNIISALQKSI